MPKRNDIKSILLIGSGPIVIGQACELAYSRTQACRTLLEEDYRTTPIMALRQQYRWTNCRSDRPDLG